MEKESLENQKNQIEQRIRSLEKKQVTDKVLESLKKLEDISYEIANMQSCLNTIWKRTKQVEQDFKEILLNEPLVQQAPQVYPQAQTPLP